MDTVIYRQGIRYSEKEYDRESEFENLVVANSKTLFGQSSIYIDVKKKIKNSALGGVIPDGFLFDLSDPENPEFYIVEVELSIHSFFNHIFPQITKFFAFFKNSESQGKLVEALYDILKSDEDFKAKIGKREIFKFIKDCIESSKNILIIIDNEKIELPEIISTYTDTWGKMVKVAILKEYSCFNGKQDTILTMTPDFENIESIDIVSSEQETNDLSTAYTEDFHLEGVSNQIREIYFELKKEILSKIPDVIFNSQRYYISLRIKRNFAFIKIKQKKITIIPMMPEQEIRKRITGYEIESLAQSVQNFYNGACARVVIKDNIRLSEVVSLLKEIQR